MQINGSGKNATATLTYPNFLCIKKKNFFLGLITALKKSESCCSLISADSLMGSVPVCLVCKMLRGKQTVCTFTALLWQSLWTAWAHSAREGQTHAKEKETKKKNRSVFV